MPDIPWPHAPSTRLSSRGKCFSPAQPVQRTHHFQSNPPPRITAPTADLRQKAQSEPPMKTWSGFSDHSRFINCSPTEADDASSLGDMLSILHVKKGHRIGAVRKPPRCQSLRIVRDTRLTHFQDADLSRLNYVRQNPVDRGLAPGRQPVLSLVFHGLVCTRGASPSNSRSPSASNSDTNKSSRILSVTNPDW